MAHHQKKAVSHAQSKKPHSAIKGTSPRGMIASLSTKSNNILTTTKTLSSSPKTKTPTARAAKRKHPEEASSSFNGNAYSALNGLQPVAKRQKVGNTPMPKTHHSSAIANHNNNGSFLNHNNHTPSNNGYRPTSMLQNGKTQVH